MAALTLTQFLPTMKIIISILLFSLLKSATCDESGPDVESSVPVPDSLSPKLLILLIDGFRWDYYDRQKKNLPGFRQLISSGVQAAYVEPIFPSLSYPSWTTLVTGLYPSQHNILGNYMLQLRDKDMPETVFQLKGNSTKSPFWWKSAEPLWITATNAGQKSYLANFASCDVPYENIMPTECTGYSYQDVNLRLREHLNKALNRLKRGYSLAMVYDDSIDHAGHARGPDSNELRVAVAHVDALLLELLYSMKNQGLQEKVNLIITSDHGMTNIAKDSGVKYIKLNEHVNTDDIYKVIDYGAVVSIAATDGKVDSLYEQLLTIPGVNVFKKQDIPDELHYKESKLVHDILLVAKPGFFIVGLEGDKQIPSDNKASIPNPYEGTHGYYGMADMRTIFFARGPAFRQGIVHPAIGLVDEYQIFTKILGLNPRPHNGTWENVSEMFAITN